VSFQLNSADWVLLAPSILFSLLHWFWNRRWTGLAAVVICFIATLSGFVVQNAAELTVGGLPLVAIITGILFLINLVVFFAITRPRRGPVTDPNRGP
jgi:hypothetical protein